MNWRENLFYPGWWKAALAGAACGVIFHMLCGCSSPAVSEPKYPEYDKWWTGTSEPRRSANLSDLGQGDILVFDNGMEAVLL